MRRASREFEQAFIWMAIVVVSTLFRNRQKLRCS
jgi:hypothetical protein